MTHGRIERQKEAQRQSQPSESEVSSLAELAQFEIFRLFSSFRLKYGWVAEGARNYPHPHSNYAFHPNSRSDFLGFSRILFDCLHEGFDFHDRFVMISPRENALPGLIADDSWQSRKAKRGSTAEPTFRKRSELTGRAGPI